MVCANQPDHHCGSWRAAQVFVQPAFLPRHVLYEPETDAPTAIHLDCTRHGYRHRGIHPRGHHARLLAKNRLQCDRQFAQTGRLRPRACFFIFFRQGNICKLCKQTLSAAMHERISSQAPLRPRPLYRATQTHYLLRQPCCTAQHQVQGVCFVK